MSSQSSSVMSTYNRFPITLTKGEGSYVYDDQNEKYLDYTSGIATCNLGHRPKAVEEALIEQTKQLWHCSNLYTIPSQEKLAHILTENSLFEKVFFSNSGAEANEGAIKLARRYAQKVKNTDRYEVVTFSKSFHGRTLATLAATGQEKIQDGFNPIMPGFRYLPYNDEQALANLVRPETCAVMLELVQGEGGVHPANQAWLDKLVNLCREHDILIIIDEIQTGIGRTGSLFAYEQYGFEPDIMTLAKGLGSGFPIGAVLAKEKIAKAFTPGSHGTTFGGNPLATTAGLATITEMVKPELSESIQTNIDYFWEKLSKLQKEAPEVKAIRGKGFLIGIEVDGEVSDFINRAREDYHLLILSAGESVLRILPPLTTSKEEIDQAVSILEKLFQSKN